MKTTDLIFNILSITLAVHIFWFIMGQKDYSNLLFLSEEQIESYEKHGILIVKEQIFSTEKLNEITKILLDAVHSLPYGSKTESSPELIHSHLKNETILKIAQEPTVVNP